MDFTTLCEFSLRQEGLLQNKAKKLNGSYVHAVDDDAIEDGQLLDRDRLFECAECLKQLRWTNFVPLGAWESTAISWHVISGRCRECDAKRWRAIQADPLYNKTLIAFCSNTVGLIQASAKRRSLPMNLSVQDVISLYINQRGRCALSGVKMTTETVRGRNPKKASVDRIDSRFGYLVGNVQYTCVSVNLMKQSLQQGEFITWCNAVARRQAEREGDLLALIEGQAA